MAGSDGVRQPHPAGFDPLPHFILAGSKDSAVPMHHARQLHTTIPSSRLVVVEGASHALIWTHSDEFIRAVEAFLPA